VKLKQDNRPLARESRKSANHLIGTFKGLDIILLVPNRKQVEQYTVVSPLHLRHRNILLVPIYSCPLVLEILVVSLPQG